MTKSKSEKRKKRTAHNIDCVGDDSSNNNQKKKISQENWEKIKAWDRLTIFIGRKNRLSFPDHILTKISSKELNYWDEQIFTKDNVDSFIQNFDR